MSDWNKNWCGSRYGPCDYDSGDKKTNKNVVKCVVKLKNCWIATKIGVVVDMDPVIMIVVTKRQKNGGKICGKMCSKMCGKIEKLSDWNRNWYGSRYVPCDYDSGDKETKRQNDKKDKKYNNKKYKERKKRQKKGKKDKKKKKKK